ncbi:MAG: cohesin domain-containing protein [Bacteroidales bacterium]
MKTLILKILPLLFVIICFGGVKAQTIVTTAVSVTSCPGEILVPINITNGNGIGAISLKLSFDSTKLSYIGYQNLNPALNAGMLIINATAGKIFISWINNTAANLGDSSIVKLRFNATTNISNLSWDVSTPGNCEYSDVNGNIRAATFSDGTVTINQPPQIIIQALDRTVLVGQNISFTVSASGTGIAYLWQISTDGGNIWNDMINNSTYSGVTSATLNITNSLLTYNNFKYKCRLTGSCSPVIFSNPATLSVINPITTTLPTASFCPGNIIVPVTVNNFNGVASFSLSFAYNSSCLSYSGYQNMNTALSGGNFIVNAIGGKIYITWSSSVTASFGNATLIELLFSSTSGTSILSWDIATDGNCEYAGSSGTLFTTVFVNGSENIYSLPLVNNHPSNQTIAKGQNTSFSISATGTSLSYIWQISSNGGVNWTDLSNNTLYTNVTTPTLNITNAQLAMNTSQYRCKVSGTCTPIVYSNAAVLTVLPNIITNCASLTACPGQIVIPINVTDFINIPSFSLTLNYNPAVLTYTGFQNLNPALSNGNFIANASNGKVLLTWFNISEASISSNGLLVELKFTAVPGTTSLIWDTQTLGNCEYVDLNGLIIFSTWNNGNVIINQPPLVMTEPANQTIYASGSTSFSITTSGAGLGYLWQQSTNNGISWSNLSNSLPFSGVYTSTLSINPVSIAMNNYLYRCIVSGSCTPSDTSNSGKLTVTMTPITTTPGTISSSCTGNLNIPINVTNCSNVGSISLTMIYDTTKLTFDGYNSANSALTGGFLTINRIANKIFMSWASPTAANIGSAVLIQYRFIANIGISTTLSWDTQTVGACEYTDLDGNIITSFYNNSNISVVPNTFNVNAGNDICIASGGSIQLNGLVTGGTTPYTYLWTPSTGLSNPAIPNPIANPALTTTYTLTVAGNNACSAFDQIIVNVNNYTGAAAAITGSALVTQGQSNVSYSVPNITNATSYVWSLPIGATIVSGINSNSIVVNYSNTAVSGNLNVYGNNTCGNGNISPNFPITVIPLICTPPSSQATVFSVSSITNTTMTIGWIRGNGDSVLVVARQGNTIDSDPVNGTAYLANPAFNNGAQIGTGNYVVYKGTGSSVNITSLSPETYYYFEVYEFNANYICYKTPGLAGSALTTALNTTFTAAASNAWENMANWNHGIPGSATNVIIPANKLAIVNSNNLQCNNLTIVALGKLTINNTGDLLVNGTMTLQSDASGTASFINNGSLNSVSNIVQRYIPILVSEEFHQLSSPVVGQSINTVFSPESQSFYTWKESTASWIPFEDPNFNTTNGGNIFIPGRGYAVSYSSTSTKNFTGVMNNGTINTALTVTSGTYAGWNLIGNPYPSAIDWNINTGFSRNMLENAGSNQSAFWVWNPVVGNYGTYITNSISGTNGVSNFINSEQGFWIKASTAGIFSINNNARIHATQPWLKSASSNTNTLILKVTSSMNTFSDEMILSFDNNNEYGGAEKKFSLYQSAPEIFSSKLNKSWSINNLTSIVNNLTVNIGFKPGLDGNFTISAIGCQSFGNLVLEDLKTGIQHNLTTNKDYFFQAQTSDFQNRFILHFYSIENNDKNKENPHVYYGNKSINIFNPWKSKTDVSINDANGRLIQSFDVKTGKTTHYFNQTQGIYIIKIQNEQGVYVEKLVIY